MPSTQVVEMSVIANSPSQEYFHPDDQIPSRYVTRGFKPFANINIDATEDVHFIVSLKPTLPYN